MAIVAPAIIECWLAKSTIERVLPTSLPGFPTGERNTLNPRHFSSIILTRTLIQYQPGMVGHDPGAFTIIKPGAKSDGYSHDRI